MSLSAARVRIIKMSYRLKIDPKSRKSAKFISQLQKKIQAELVATGMTQQQVAEILGVDRSVINRRLKGSANLTARSIAEFAYAFDKNVVLEFADPDRPKMANRTVGTHNVGGQPLLKQNSPTGSVVSRKSIYIESAAS